MASWTQKKQLFAIGSGALGICLVAVGGVFYAQSLIDEVNAQAETKKQAISAAEGKISQIPGVEREVIILRENLGEYVKILPDTKELNAFVRILNQFERQTGIQGTLLQQKNARGNKKSERFTPIEYSYEMTATLWQFLKFVNLVESLDRFVNVSEFSITSGAKGRTEEMRDGDVVHNVRLTMQTYTYNGKAAGKDVVIPAYEDKKAALREEIFKRMQAIKIEKFDYKGEQGRRDILIDPRERGDLKQEGPSPKVQLELVVRYAGEIAKLREMLQRMRKPETTLFEQYALEKGVRDGLTKMVTEIDEDEVKISYAPYRLKWAKDVVAPLEELRSQVAAVAKDETKRPDPFLPKKDMEQLVAEMATALKAGQLEEAKNRYESVAARLNVPAEDPRHDLAVAAKALQVKASTALDFKGMDLRVQGVVVNRSGRSGVLLNGEVYEEGDYVSDELLIKLVEEEQVWFVFRGLTLVRTM